MYNRYMNSGFDDMFVPVENEPRPGWEATGMAEPKREEKKGGILSNLFGGGIKLPEFDSDTILLLVLVYFLIAEENENITDTLLIIGVLLILGF